MGSKEIVAALKAKGMTPREAVRALGLDEDLLSRENLMKRPTKLAAHALLPIVRGVSPLLAMDAKVDFMPIVADLTRKNFSAQRVLAAVRNAIKNKTIAKDADLSHVETALKKLEQPHEPGKELPGAGDFDESVSEPQHNAMMAAAKGESNLGIPKDVGKEFAEADKGKGGFDKIVNFLHDRGMSDDDISHLQNMLPSPISNDVHHYHGARDESESEEERERREKEAEDRHMGRDAKHHHHYAGDESEEERRAAEDRRRADDKLPGKDKMVTKDELTREVAAATARERKNQSEIRIALDEARPIVGELRSDLAFDTADAVRRQVLKMKGITAPADAGSAALKQMIAMLPRGTGERRTPREPQLGADQASTDTFNKMFPGAARIRAV